MMRQRLIYAHQGLEREAYDMYNWLVEDAQCCWNTLKLVLVLMYWELPMLAESDDFVESFYAMYKETREELLHWLIIPGSHLSYVGTYEGDGMSENNKKNLSWDDSMTLDTFDKHLNPFNAECTLHADLDLMYDGDVSSFDESDISSWSFWDEVETLVGGRGSGAADAPDVDTPLDTLEARPSTPLADETLEPTSAFTRDVGFKDSQDGRRGVNALELMKMKNLWLLLLETKLVARRSDHESLLGVPRDDVREQQPLLSRFAGGADEGKSLRTNEGIEPRSNAEVPFHNAQENVKEDEEYYDPNNADHGHFQEGFARGTGEAEEEVLNGTLTGSAVGKLQRLTDVVANKFGLSCSSHPKPFDADNVEEPNAGQRAEDESLSVPVGMRIQGTTLNYSENLPSPVLTSEEDESQRQPAEIWWSISRAEKHACFETRLQSTGEATNSKGAISG
ncbi:hypothetical protein L7F22_031688 [Adiantum nelumboides]|nr:hypothetical protein [Adiantum nelumboides]